MRDESTFLEEICVFVFSYDINDQGNNIKRKVGRHCGMLSNEVTDAVDVSGSATEKRAKYKISVGGKGALDESLNNFLPLFRTVMNTGRKSWTLKDP